MKSCRPSPRTAQQGVLWPDPSEASAANPTGLPVLLAGASPAAAIRKLRQKRPARAREHRHTIQDLLFEEGLFAARLSAHSDSLETLQRELVNHFRQNSLETRTRYAQSVLKWFFSDGLGGLARAVWTAYEDEKIESDILRYRYLFAEPIVGACLLRRPSTNSPRKFGATPGASSTISPSQA